MVFCTLKSGDIIYHLADLSSLANIADTWLPLLILSLPAAMCVTAYPFYSHTIQANVRELKAHLSEYLRCAAEGEDVTVSVQDGSWP